MKTFLEHIKENFNKQESSDILIEIYNKNDVNSEAIPLRKIYGHTLVLCRCEYWKGMLSIDTKEKINKKVRLFIYDDQWMSIESLRVFLECFYIDEKSFAKTNEILSYLTELHYLSNFIGFTELERYTESKIAANLTTSNIVNLLEYIVFLNKKECYLYKVIFQWIFAFYPRESLNLQDSLNEVFFRDESESLLDRVLKSDSMMFENPARDRQILIKKYISWLEVNGCDNKRIINAKEKYPEIIIEDNDNNNKNVIRKCIYYTIKKKKDLIHFSSSSSLVRKEHEHTILPLSKHFKFDDLNWKLLLVGIPSPSSSCCWVSMTANTIITSNSGSKSTNSLLLLSPVQRKTQHHQKHQHQQKKLNISVTIREITPSGTITTKSDGIITPDDCRYDIPYEQYQKSNKHQNFGQEPFSIENVGKVIPFIFEMKILHHF